MKFHVHDSDVSLLVESLDAASAIAAVSAVTGLDHSHASVAELYGGNPCVPAITLEDYAAGLAANNIPASAHAESEAGPDGSEAESDVNDVQVQTSSESGADAGQQTPPVSQESEAPEVVPEKPKGRKRTAKKD